ncbi:glycosyltransferase [Balneolaceae bacterium YR4-1]|uniref:Glycosyltransferase n=1 Tax=Halalkalibaculum roseum TaxID=2709311 RepID=A0A6M1T7U8_9BACT|nr:glycosyltransferase [Halalkalibaculum roseum]NGP78025.1 glycosyltransferase [Halalkalibaculum roseum]
MKLKIHDLIYDTNVIHPRDEPLHMTDPLVSAIITTKNRSGMLPRALVSVRNQSYPNIEIVIVDDGSTDLTPKVIEDFEYENRLIHLRNEESLGACRARNQGIAASSGTFIAGLDDDDEWHPDRIKFLVDAYSDEFACITSDVRLAYPKRTVQWSKEKVITFNDLLYSNQVGNQVLVKKERLEKIGGFDENLEAAQDYDLWLRLAETFGPIKNVNKPLQTIHLDHEAEQITNPKSQLAGYLEFYKKHKAKMNLTQRKYQLFQIRRAQGKVTSFWEIFRWVPHSFWLNEAKRYLAKGFLKND